MPTSRKRPAGRRWTLIVVASATAKAVAGTAQGTRRAGLPAPRPERPAGPRRRPPGGGEAQRQRHRRRRDAIHSELSTGRSASAVAPSARSWRARRPAGRLRRPGRRAGTNEIRISVRCGSSSRSASRQPASVSPSRAPPGCHRRRPAACRARVAARPDCRARDRGRPQPHDRHRRQQQRLRLGDASSPLACEKRIWVVITRNAAAEDVGRRERRQRGQKVSSAPPAIAGREQRQGHPPQRPLGPAPSAAAASSRAPSSRARPARVKR